MLSACVETSGIDVSLLGTDWRIYPVVLRVEWLFDGKHFFIRKPYEVDCRITVSLQKLLAASQTGNAIGFRQLLCTASFNTLQLEITINYSVHSRSLNASFT